MIYHPTTASLEWRKPPPDVGWNVQDQDIVKSRAAELRDPEAPLGDYIPRCPVHALAIRTWIPPDSEPDIRSDSELMLDFQVATKSWQGSPPPETSLGYERSYEQASLPSHIEDALLGLYEARNQWLEGLLTFDQALKRHYSRKPADAVERAREAHGEWLPRVKELIGRLKARGRAARLTEAERAEVRAAIAEHSSIRDTATGNKHRPHWSELTRTSLATLLLNHPEAASARAEEVAAAHPGLVAARSNEQHRMLGHGHPVQQNLAYDAVMLLQLGSDFYRPRFCWWDAGNITFWIKRADLAERRFDKAKAEIEGH